MVLSDIPRFLPVARENGGHYRFLNIKQGCNDPARSYPSTPLVDPNSIYLHRNRIWKQPRTPTATGPQCTFQLHQEPDDMCIDEYIEMKDGYATNPSEPTNSVTVPSLTFDHTYDQIHETNQMQSIYNDARFEIDPMFDVYNESNICPALLLNAQTTPLQASYISVDSAIDCCVSAGIESEIQNAVTHSMLSRLPDHRISDLLGGGLDKLLPMENTTIIVTHKDYRIYRYWTQQDTIFGYNPNHLQNETIERILNAKSFIGIYNHQRTESYDECILFCGDRIKVITSAREERWVSFWMKESKIDDGDYYTFVFIDNCVPIARFHFDETGCITEYQIIFGGSDITDYINVEPEKLQGHHYQQVIPAINKIDDIDNWYISKHGVHYFTTYEQSSMELIAIPSITGLVSVNYDETIAWCSETLACCLFGITPKQAEGSEIIERLPQHPSVIQYPSKIDDWLEDADKIYNDSTFQLKDLIHGGTLMYEWCRNKFKISGLKSNDVDEKPNLVALRNGNIETPVELYVKFSSRENVPHWVFVKNILEWGTTLANYKVLEDRIGQGSYGSVYTAYDKRSLRQVTIKYVSKSRVIRENNRGKKSLPMEIEVLKVLQRNTHPNCCEMYTYFDDPTYYYIVTGNYGQTLFSFIEENPNLPEKHSQYIFGQIAMGVHHLHEKLNIVHRDLKDENILVDDHLRIRLIDFGSAAILKTKGRKFNTFVGTVDYAAPEVLSGQTYTGKPQDIWALGVLLYTIIHQSNPFSTAADIIDGNLEFPFQLDYDLRGLIVGMLSGINARYDIKAVVSHKWLHKEIK